MANHGVCAILNAASGKPQADLTKDMPRYEGQLAVRSLSRQSSLGPGTFLSVSFFLCFLYFFALYFAAAGPAGK